jgi:ribose 1,5-bisphosphokinase PhnN
MTKIETIHIVPACRRGDRRLHAKIHNPRNVDSRKNAASPSIARGPCDRPAASLDVARFRAMAENGEFAEWAEVHGHLYGTSRAQLAAHAVAGNDVILDIDTQGASILRKSFPDGVFVFIVPPSWAALEARLRRRQPSPARGTRAGCAR